MTDASGYTGYTERSSIGPDGEEVRATLFNPNKHVRALLWLGGAERRWWRQIRWWEKAPGWLQDTAKEVRALSLHGLRPSIVLILILILIVVKESTRSRCVRLTLIVCGFGARSGRASGCGGGGGRYRGLGREPYVKPQCNRCPLAAG